ncbi:MAG: energy-coupling factor transporter transmembrane component T [Ruminococcus sp.]|nr:energy-coupling factor transporter transmembrane component T [Ruminococcus sp.]
MRFDSYHPVINLIYFVTVLICTVKFFHPVFLCLAYLSAFLWSAKLNGKKALIFNLCLIPVIFLYTGWYSFYNHFGMTILGYNFIGNQITLESIVYGFVRGVAAVSVVMECTCIFAVVTTDKVVYLLGRISPRLSLACSILLRMTPRIIGWAKKTERARQGIGKGIGQGNPWKRFLHLVALLSMTITWTMENLVESAASMKCRGSSLKGRTAFSMYRFDDRDRMMVVAFVFGIMVTTLANTAGETNILYQPMIMMKPITMSSIVCYLIYGMMLLLPLGLQIIGEIRFEQMRKHI